MIKNMTIKGLKSFISPVEIDFCSPDGQNKGSGLNILAGSNNSGKTTIIDSLRMAIRMETPTFTVFDRSSEDGIVEVRVQLSNDRDAGFKTVESGGSACKWIGENPTRERDIVFVPSRRYFNPIFNKSYLDRQQYNQSVYGLETKTVSIDPFSYRLYSIHENTRVEFNKVINDLLGYELEWTIDMFEQDRYFLKIPCKNGFHNSMGIGDGLISLLFIVSAILDAQDGSMLVIDEPELSLHPSIQRRLCNLLLKISKSTQIIVSTHSPYFVPSGVFGEVGKLIRTVKTGYQSNVCSITEETKTQLARMGKDLHNPHLFGLNMREILFMEDGIIVVEGQEDVVIFNKILNDTEMNINGEFLGWGSGGADKMRFIAMMLSDLGFKKVIFIYDGDKTEVKKTNNRDYPHYMHINIPTEDIRDKPSRKGSEEKTGIVDRKGVLKEEYAQTVADMIKNINRYLA